MNAVFRDIFRAVHEGKWLSIEYHNREDQNGSTSKTEEAICKARDSS